MRFVEFKHVILEELSRNPGGLTWIELKERLALPYSTPCPTWVSRMEQEDGLYRERGARRAYLWKVSQDNGDIIHKEVRDPD